MGNILDTLFRKKVHIVIGIVAGAMLGGGIAYAHVEWQDMQSGTQIYETSHSDYHFNTQVDYDEDHVAWASGDYEHFRIEDAGYWNGTVSGTYDLIFGVLYIYDEYGENSTQHTDFVCQDVDGINTVEFGVDWELEGMEPPNDLVVAEQWLHVKPSNGCIGGPFDIHEFVWSQP